MSMFSVKQTPIEDLLVITPTVEGGDREYLENMDDQEILNQMGIPDVEFVECSVEKFARGVIRGLHFQRKDSYAKLISVVSGRILDVAVDLRPESKTFGAAHSVELNADNGSLFYIPPYFAHGFLTLEANTEVVCNFAGEHDVVEESGIIWDDEILAIDWQFERYDIDPKWLNISGRDKNRPSFRSYNQNTLWINRPKPSKYALASKLLVKY